MGTYKLTNSLYGSTIDSLSEDNSASYSSDKRSKTTIGKAAAGTYFVIKPNTSNTTSGDFGPGGAGYMLRTDTIAMSFETTEVYTNIGVSTTYTRLAERITYTGTVTAVAFKLLKAGSPTGTIYGRIRDAATDAIIAEGSMDVSALGQGTSGASWTTFVFSSPVTLNNQDVRFCVEYSTGDSSNYVCAYLQNPGSYSNGIYSSYYNGAWQTDTPTVDLCFRIYQGATSGSYFPAGSWTFNIKAENDTKYTYAGIFGARVSVCSNPSGVLSSSGSAYGSNLNTIAQDDTYVYIAGYTPYTVQKFLKSDMSYIGATPAYGSEIRSIAVDDLYIYAGGCSNEVKKYLKSDMSYVSTTSGFGNIIERLVIDDTYLYVGGQGNVVKKYLKSDMSYITTTPSYGGFVYGLAVDDTYLYVGGSTTYTVRKYLKSNMSYVGQTASYGGTVNYICVDDTHIYATGTTSVGCVKKYLKSDMSYVAATAVISTYQPCAAVDSTYLYVGFYGGSGNVVKKYLKSDMSYIMDTYSYSASGVREIVLDNSCIYAAGYGGTASATKYYKSDGVIATVDSINTLSFPGTAGSQVTDSWTYSMPRIDMTKDQFLFVDFRFKVTTAASNSGAIFSFVTDENPSTGNENIVTTALTASGTDTSTTPAAMTASSSVNIPTITAQVITGDSAYVNPVVIGNTLTFNTPAVDATTSISAFVDPLVIANTSAGNIPTITVSKNATVTPAVVVASSVVKVPTIAVTWNTSITPSYIAASSVVNIPVISTGVNFSVNAPPMSNTSSVINPAISTAVNVQPGAVNSAAVLNNPTVGNFGNANIGGVAFGASSNINNPTVSSDANIAVTVIENNIYSNSPLVGNFTNANISCGPMANTSGLINPVITAEGSTEDAIIIANKIDNILEAHGPVISCDVAVQSDCSNIIYSLLNPTILVNLYSQLYNLEVTIQNNSIKNLVVVNSQNFELFAVDHQEFNLFIVDDQSFNLSVTRSINIEI